MPPIVLPHRYAMVRVGDLKPHPANANVGDTDAIAESIEAIGFYGALNVQESTGYILAGEHRWRAAQAEGLAELPAIVIDCDDDVASRILGGDNRYAQLAHWDTGKLAALLESYGHDLRGTGFTESDRLIAIAGAEDLAAVADRDYSQGHLGPVLVIHAPMELIAEFRARPGADDLARLRGLLDATRDAA